MSDDDLERRLKQQAMLALSWEREVHTLRNARDRTSAWLRAFHRLSLDAVLSVESTLATWAELLVRGLDFQTAAAYAHEENSMFRLVAIRANGPRPPRLELDPQLMGLLRGTPQGMCVREPSPIVARFATVVGLGRFLWFTFKLDRKLHVLVAGFDPETSTLRPQLPPADFDYFTMLGRNVSLLLSNSQLISDLERDRAELRKSVATIEKDAEERLRLEGQLAHSERVASLGRLCAGVAHEINNPLTSIVANIDVADEAVRAALASGDRPGPIVLEALADATAAATRVADIVSDLRAFARKDDGKATPLDVPTVVETAIQLASNQLRHRATLRREYGPVPFVDANEARFVQVVLNLLINAIQAIPEDGSDAHEICVRIGTTDGWALLEVIDSGVGIAEDAITRIFDPFYTTKGVGEGTGLGLSICHVFVESWGGRIEASSVIGQGSVFRVLLPPTATVPPPKESAKATGPIPQLPPRRGRVLLIDDDQDVLRAAQRGLAFQHDVVAMDDAEAALRMLIGGERFDVILCDVMMPRMNGQDFYEALAAKAPDVAPRVVFVTGGAFTPKTHDFLAHVRHMEKPLSLAKLRKLVTDAIDKSS
jgi:signal transduction histidine kinase/CheY-like chemotaxis protein